MTRTQSNTPHPSQPVVSARGYARILADSWLRRALIPGGLLLSPYRVLDYEATLTLEDEQGMRATFRRRQRVRFQHDGVVALLDHAWGRGVIDADYHNDAGTLEGSLLDAGRRHLVIGLPRRMQRGDTLTFHVQRQAIAGFLSAIGRVETAIDHPIERLSRTVIFPKTRPCRRALLEFERQRLPLPVLRDGRGRTFVHAAITRPRANVTYTVRWLW